MNNLFSLNLRFIRKASKVTQTQLADNLGTTPTSISNWENEISAPNFETLIAISNFFDVSIDNLLKSNLTRGEAQKPLPPSALSNEQLNKLEFYEAMIKAHCSHLAELLNLS